MVGTSRFSPFAFPPTVFSVKAGVSGFVGADVDFLPVINGTVNKEEGADSRPSSSPLCRPRFAATCDLERRPTWGTTGLERAIWRYQRVKKRARETNGQ